MSRWRKKRYRDLEYYFYPRSAPRKVEEGGIRARSKRGAFAISWWGKRWLSVLEGFLIEGRLARGRSYARSGQVRSLEISAGKINASVQGSRPKPYMIKIEVDILPETKWQALAAHFSEDASLVAKLLNGELPEDAERLFDDLRIKLLPKSDQDIRMDCNCPDYSVPCKHLAAVLYLIAEELDRDPFLVFLLRGKKRDEFLGMLNATAGELPMKPQVPAQPLPADAQLFWKPFDPKLQQPLSFRPPDMAAALAKRLGPLPFWQGESPFIETMERLYRDVSANALARLKRAESEAVQE